MFLLQEFTAHSGQRLDWKIECDNLTTADWMTLAKVAADMLPPFGAVEGVPSGGLALADALRTHATEGPLLIVDDVLTTGGSMEHHRAGRDAIGIVAFARGPLPPWVKAIFSVNQ
jgi:hypothetical protein